jgi:hypothetical protein
MLSIRFLLLVFSCIFFLMSSSSDFIIAAPDSHKFSCAPLQEPAYKEYVKNHIDGTIESMYSVIASSTLPSIYQSNKVGTCKVGTDGITHVCIPIYSLHHMGLGSGSTTRYEPSPFWLSSYSAKQLEKYTFFTSLIKTIDSVPGFGSIANAIRFPLTAIFTHGISLLNAGRVYFTNGFNWEDAKTYMYPQTVSLLGFFDLKAYGFSWTRQVYFVMVVDRNTKKPITKISHPNIDLRSAYETFAVALPPGVQSCADIADPHKVRSQFGESKTIRCRDRYTFDLFHSPMEFVNSLVGFIARLFRNRVTVRRGADSRSPVDQSFFDDAFCSIDTTYYSGEPEQQCFFVACSNMGACSAANGEIQIHHQTETDFTTPVLLALNTIFWFIRPFAAQSVVVRWILCTVFGIVILFIMLGFLVYTLTKDSRTAQLGIAVASVLGTSYFAVSGFLGLVTEWFLNFLASNVYAALVLGVMCVASVYIAHTWFGPSMPTIVNIAMYFAQYGTFIAAALRNAELVFSIMGSYIFFRYIVKNIIYMIFYFLGLGEWFTYWFGNDVDSPKDAFPAWVSELKEFVRPIHVAGVIVGETAEHRDKLYRQQGNHYTRQQLNNLYRELNANPEKYANKFSNPNAVFSAVAKN